MILPVGTANHTQIGFVVGLADLTSASEGS